MTTREVVLDGGSPWGFRMHGGVDVQQPLRISRVNPGSKAAIKGVREGDIITSINNQPTRDTTNADAHVLLKKSGDTLKLGLNEDCRGSPKRRQYKTVQQETHSESIERSSTSKSSYSTSTSVTINRNQSDSTDTENPILVKTNGHLEKNGDPDSGVISQRSTLSSTDGSSPTAASLFAESRGIGIEIHQAARDTAARNNDSSGITTVVVTKPVSADNEKDVIADTEMGGNSRSHKKRSRASRKRSKNSNVVSTDASTGETMVEVPSSPLNSDVTERGNDVDNSAASTTENAEVQSIAENRVLERVQTNYRVESPETVSKKTNANKKQNGGAVVKSKSLDDDDLLKITELSEASEGEDKSVSECNAVVSEAESDVEWEITEEIKSEEKSEECLSTMTLPLEEELETVHVTLISPEDERNLRNFLEGLNLATAPEETTSQAQTQTQKKENYKERKARKRAAIAEHFMPVLQFPRFLDVIREEGSDNSSVDREATPCYSSDTHHFIKSQEFVRSKGEQSIEKKMETHFPKSESEKVLVVGGKLTEATNVEGTWSTSMAETSSSGAEIVYIDDSSTSKTPSETSDVEDNGDADGEDEESKSEGLSQYSSLQELNTDTSENVSQKPIDTTQVLPPPSQLTPPPTPDLSTPKNETVCDRQQLESEINDFIKNVMSYLSNGNYGAVQAITKDARFQDLPEETKKKVDEFLTENSDTASFHDDVFNKEFKGFCDELNLHDPCNYVNAISPSRSPSVSSEASSKTNSQCTARYNPMCSSIADVADLLKDEENVNDALKVYEPETLRELCLRELMSLPFGADVLEELAEVSQSIQELTGSWQTKITPSLQRLRKHFPTPIIPAFMSKKPIGDDTNSSFTVPATKEEMPFNPSTKWVGMPTQQDPKVLVCLSPTQKSYLETTRKVPDEAGKLLELHQKFMNRRGYHEEIQDEPKKVGIIGLADADKDQNSSKTGEFSNRLLAIIRESSAQHNDDSRREGNHSKLEETSNLPLDKNLNSAKFKMQDLTEWLHLVREKSASAPHLDETNEFSNASVAGATGTYQSKAVNEGSSDGNTTRSTNISSRRFSLPQEVHQRQIQYIREKEKELQEEIEKLEKEKRKVISEMAAEVPFRQFESDKYHISKKGDVAIRTEEEEKFSTTETEHQRTTPMAPTEFFRQKMYDEYMRKVAAREERKMHKVIKITSSTRTSQVEESTDMCEVTHASGIEDEFMDKVKERMRKYGLKRDDSEEPRNVVDASAAEDNGEPVLVMDGDFLKDAKELPKHLQEFVDITRRAADNSEDEMSDGVWSPGQKPAEYKPKENIHESQEHRKKNDPISPVWTPRSAGSSPTAERKEFRPVNFESPVLERKNKPKAESSGTPHSPSIQPPWQVPDGSSDLGVALSSSLERRIPTSHSAPASGFTEFSVPRLPRAQNPTITLLQKAREGQLPRGASYIQADPTYSYRNQDDRPPLLGPGEVLYQIKNEYTSESDSERPRKMADLGPRKYEIGIGPTTKDGMPLVLRSEVRDGNQSRWYKRMYDTIHKQKPDPRYPYSSGYFSEPEHSAFSADYYDSDGTVSDSKYATLDRRRFQPGVDKENDYMSSTVPRDRDTTNGDIIRHGQDVYKNQPGRIENYLPGRSSISEKEAKEWWDEVMDIFDGWLDDHSALPSYNYLLSRAITRSHLEQQKNVPQPRGYMSQALKESGYESDSTLVFRRREDAVQQLSPSEQREAYKHIQKGGDVPLHGLRKPAPERPREDAEIEYFPISPTLTRIRIHKNTKPQNQVLCYPLSVPPHPRHVFAEYKRSAPSASVSSIPKPPPIPPSPPKRRSSRNSNTLRLISTMKVRTEKSPSSKRHETCFTSTSNIDRNKVKYLKDKITCKLSPTPKRKGESETKPRLKVTKTVSVSPSLRSSITSTLSTSKASPNKVNSRTDINLSKDHCCLSRSLSASPIRKMCKTCTLNIPKKTTSVSKPKPGTFGSEKRKVDLTLPDKHSKLVKSTDLLSPTEVKKAVISQINSLPAGTTYKKSQALYSSVRNGLNSSRETALPIQVGFSPRGRELLRSSRVSTSLPATPVLSRTLRTRNTTPSPCPSEKSKDSSQKSQSASLDSLKSLKMFKKNGTSVSKSTSLSSLRSNKSLKQKSAKDITLADSKKLKKSKKDQLNGEIAKRDKKTKIKPTEKSAKKCAGKAAGTEIVRKLRSMEEHDEASENIYALTQDAIQKQREAIQTNSFFQHLFWRDIPSPPPSIASQSSWIAEKTRLLQRNASSFSEPSIGALKIYLNHTKPVTDSKFRSLDAALVRSRSASPKSVTWKIDKPASKDEKFRSISLPPKLIFTRTTRPVSPILVRRQTPKLSLERRRHDSERSVRHGSPAKLIFTETTRPVSPVIGRKIYPRESFGSEERLYSKRITESPSAKMIFSETSRPVSPLVEKRSVKRDYPKSERSSSPSKLIFTETSRPVSPIVTRKHVDRSHDCGIKKSFSSSKLIFTETSRPISPVIERKRNSKRDVKYLQQCLEAERERTVSPSSKLFFSETSRPVSPVVERRYPRSSSPSLRQIYMETKHTMSPLAERKFLHKERSSSPTAKLIFTETSRPVSPVVERRYTSPKFLHPFETERSSSPTAKLFFSETSRPVSPVIEKRYIKETSDRDRSSSPSSKLFFTETNRPISPVVERKFIKKPPEQERSFSPTSKLFFTETSRPVSPIVQRKLVRAPTPPSPPIFRSPSSRKITQTKTSRSVEETKRKPIRSRSADYTEEVIFDDDTQSIASTDMSQAEYKTYFTEILHSPRRCSRFKELNKFYSTLERMGELERTTSSSELRPRRKHEEEIIDFDRWKEVHTRERAEKELETLYIKLKDDQKEKGFLFRPKQVEAYRWRRELDRGLRIKDKSVENIKDSFEKLKESSYKSVIPDELVFRRDLYKPLWRGNSVADLASSMVERRSQSEGRVTAIRKKLLESERLLTHGIGSRIWSSLSSEQINLLKGQLAEIYSQNGQRKYQVSPADYNIDVSADSHKPYRPRLSVRRNSDELVRQRHLSEPSRTSDVMSTSLVLSENDKKRLSQSLSREVMDRVSQRQKHRTSLSLVLGKETRGAIAAAEAKMKSTTSEVASPRTCYSLEMSEDEKDRKHRDSDFVLVLTKDDTDAHKNNINATMQEWAQPKTALVSTDVTNRVTSMSETESGSTDESTKTVVYLGNKDVQKKVEYFEQVAEEQPYMPTIYRAADGHNNEGEPATDTQQDLEICHTEELRQPRKLVPSQSYQDFKELFGEQEQNKFVAAALAAVRPPPPNSNSSNASTSKPASNENLSPSRIVQIMRSGEVQHLKDKFEHMEDFYSHRSTSAPRRSRSNPELNMKDQISIPGQAFGEVDTLRRKYEYPWIFSRGRSRIRRGGVVSPIYFRAGDRYMPHINIISKIASLYPKKTVFLSDVRQKSAEELAKILGCPLGEVERLRQKFDSPDRNISLLGHMFTSSPNMHELRDIAPYLTGPWTAHKYPKMEDNTRSLSSPENILPSWDTSSLRKDRPRPKSVSPPRLKAKLSPILKSRQRVVAQNGSAKQSFDPRIHQPVRRYQPPCPKIEPVRYKSSWPQTTRPSVTFKEAEAPTPPPKGHHGIDFFETESPRKYVENEVTIHYKSPIRQEVKESLSEEELSRRQAEHMKRVYEEERRRKYLQVSDSVNELQDMNSRRHTDNFIPSQKSPIPLNRYDDFPSEDSPKIKPRPRSPELRLVARALYNFVGQSARELTFRKGDVIYVRRQVDKNWYEGEHNAMIGLFPANYVEIIPYDGLKSTPRKGHEGQARAKFNFIAQTHLELSLAKGELVVITRRVDDNWFEGRIGGRKGIFPVSYVEVLIDPGTPLPPTPVSGKPVASPAAHSMLVNGSSGGKESMGSHSYLPSIPHQQQFTSSYRAKPVQISGGGNYGSLTKSASNSRNPINEALHIDTHSEPVPYRALYKYRPQNDDELELLEGDVVYVLEKCDDGWYVGSSQRTGAFGTFPGNYVERI